MKILVTGASGFIGSRLMRELRAAGHTVIGAYRDPPSQEKEMVRADFVRDVDPQIWVPRLAGIDAVVNAVGILREHGKQTFAAVHARTPCALFEACTIAGVRRVVQVSALGAETGRSGYFTSKHAADERLARLPLDWTIVQPSIVYGPGGTSARLFTLLASLPFVPVPGRGEQRLQPIHIDDVVAALVTVITTDAAACTRIALVGPHVVTLREMLLRLRTGMGLNGGRVLPIPMPIMRIAARVGGRLPGSLLDSETLDMLEAGNTADPSTTQRLLGRRPREVAQFIEQPTRGQTLRSARLQWGLPLLRVSIAAVWIWTGIVSLGLFPTTESYALLARTGISGPLASLMLYGAAALDLALGIATLVTRQRRTLWLIQIALILGYTAIITVWLPEFWLHPYGPVLKNLPLLAAIYLLYSLEDGRWNT